MPPRTPLTRDRILRAAVELADQEGAAALSMRKLAKAVGVEAMSLYNHVANKDDLLDGIVDLVVAEIYAPRPDGDWRRELRHRATSAHEVLLAHRWATPLIGSRVNVGPAMLGYVEATLGCLVTAGFTYEQADRAWNAIDSHIYGFTLQAITFPLDPSEYASAASQFLPLIPAETHPHMHTLSTQVISGTHSGAADFTFGLDLLLDGLTHLLHRNNPS
ncbi:TetR/AcrR family transcriptional regulator [Nocardia mangyaensis]|uniref:TetR/AcrR family transcriptional regulator n=1 Tax=Nocardia mangyaensis TaxID=2213200 RepID=UPI002674A7E0|nr:TetR/AcrR family transcriptional regulator C-terminal domain-containing protein [Nocardia mangyaensis]MDO3649774.1 TetR/AcrR family transcriptional regulator C-terminal domain-containing protein [Nocardia mangyaensis]